MFVNEENNFSPSVQYNTLGALVDQFATNVDLPVDHYFDKFLSWAFWGMKELHLDIYQSIKTAELPISDLKTVTLPSSYVDWICVGIRKGQYYIPLASTDQLAMTERTQENINFGETYPPGWLPNGVAAGAYGFFFNNTGGVALPQLGGTLPSKGFFRILEKGGCSEIYLDIGVAGDTIYLEYITSGFSDCEEETIVNDYFSNYVLKFLNFQYESFKKGPEKSEAAIYRTGKELFDAVATVRGRRNNLDRSSLLAIQRRQYRLTNKS